MAFEEKWDAVESTDMVGLERKLRITGIVEVPSTSAKAKLERADPQGINPEILLLNLIIEGADQPGGAVMTPHAVEPFEEPVTEGQYRQVQVEGHATIDVTVAHS